MIEAFITNLGKYVEGELCGEYLKLPATKEDVQALLSRIGVDGVLYEETFHYPDVNTEEELGYFLIDELGVLEIPEYLEQYFDYEAYGRDAHLSGGVFTDNGYIERNGGSFIEHYSGRDDLPDEHRIFAYPDPPEKMPIMARLELYGKMVAAQPAAERPAPARAER